MSRKPASDNRVVRLADFQAPKSKTLSSLEEAVERAKREAAAGALESAVASLEPEDGSPKACPSCGRLTKVHTKNVGRSVETLHGQLTLTRQYHYCRECRVGFYPRDAELGLPEDGAVSLELERRILDFGINGPYEECAERWNLHYPHMPLSANQFRQVVERVGKRAEQSDRRCLWRVSEETDP